MDMNGGWVLELDIESFFDTVDHGHLRSMLDQRVCGRKRITSRRLPAMASGLSSRARSFTWAGRR